VPTTEIVHYKGESTKKDNIDYIKTFHLSLYKFFQKYYGSTHIILFRWIIVLGIFFRGIFIYLKNIMRNQFPLVADTTILNCVILLSFIVRLNLKDEYRWDYFFQEYIIINLISTVIFLSLAFYLEVYPKHRLSVQSIIKTNVLTFILLASLTFFFKQFAYSRIVVLMSAIFSPTFMILWRVVLKRFYKGEISAWGKDIFSKRTVIVGDGNTVKELYRKITDMKDISYDMLGIITVSNGVEDGDINKMQILGKLENLPNLVKLHRIKQIIFSTEKLSYEQILKSMSRIEYSFIEYKIVPSNLEVMIGKSNIERLDDYPLLEIEYSIGNPFNKFVKRTFDILFSTLVLLVTSPLALPFLLIKYERLKKIEINSERKQKVSIYQLGKKDFKRWINRWLLFWEVVWGKISIVGSPIIEYRGKNKNNFGYKPGLTGIVQINRKKIRLPEDVEKYHLFYLKNQSLLLDLEILLKAFFQKLLFTEE
jgi:lipopolysaccharide/colanic/teichoic acid biosynthesis glycosyltransferase